MARKAGILAATGRLLIAAVAAGAIAACSAAPTPSPQRFEVNAAMTPAGERWPLTVDSAEVICGPTNQLLLGVPDNSGTIYWLNGLAKQTHKYADINAIWKDDPDVPGLKIAMWLTTYGVEKCQVG